MLKLFFNKSYINNLKRFNSIKYTTFLLCIKFVKTITKVFQKYLIIVYTISLQNNRLPFKILPMFVNNFMFFLYTQEEFYHLFARVKQQNYNVKTNNLNSNFFNTFWILYFSEKIKYKNELNTNKQKNIKIANFYYEISLKNKKYKPVMYFFFNKIVFYRYLYFYKNFLRLNNNPDFVESLSSKSQNLKTSLFFILIQNFNIFFKKNKTQSFEKITLSTFKGIQNYFVLTKINKIKYNYLNKTLLRNALSPALIINNNKKFTSNFVKIQTRLTLNLSTITNLFKLKWFNKIHNTIIDLKQNNVVLYLRVAKHFNKGRYSRNRQLYRTGVYWCIWLNIVLVYGLHYYFYRVVFVFGYLWLPLCIMILSIFGSRLYKYRYYSFYQVKNEFISYSNLLYLFFMKMNVFVNTLYEYLNHVGLNSIKNYLFLLWQYLTTKFFNLLNLFLK